MAADVRYLTGSDLSQLTGMRGIALPQSYSEMKKRLGQVWTYIGMSLQSQHEALSSSEAEKASCGLFDRYIAQLKMLAESSTVFMPGSSEQKRECKEVAQRTYALALRSMGATGTEEFPPVFNDFYRTAREFSGEEFLFEIDRSIVPETPSMHAQDPAEQASPNGTKRELRHRERLYAMDEPDSDAEAFGNMLGAEGDEEGSIIRETEEVAVSRGRQNPCRYLLNCCTLLADWLCGTRR